MLALTDSARTAIGEILAGTPDPETTGLRIAQSASVPGALDLSLATVPAEGDAVIEDEAARLFLDERVVAALANRVLDAETGVTGSVEFRIAASA